MKKRSLFVIFLFLVFVSIIQNARFPKVLSSYYSKEVCSCLFVVGQSFDYCDAFGSQVLPNWYNDIDYSKKEITSWGLWYKTKARFLSKQEGCQIVH